VGAAGDADPAGPARGATALDRHAGGDERHTLFAAYRLPVALSAARQLSAALDGIHIFRMFQRDGTWEAISAELHMALRERMGREAAPRRRCSTASRSNRPKRGRQRQPSGLRRRQAGEGP
jgi:hypothetical protein